MEDVVENIRDHLEAHPRTSLTRLSLQNAVHVIKLLDHLHPYKVTTVQ
jgi:ribosomal protein S15P/S13E